MLSPGPTLSDLNFALEVALRQQKAEDSPNATHLNEQFFFEHEGPNVHIAICGSQIRDVKDWTQNFSTTWQKRIGQTKFKATAGYVEAAKNCRHKIAKELGAGDFNILLSGHSKGAAQAPIVAILLAELGYRVLPPIRMASPRFSMQAIPHYLVNESIHYATLTDYVPKWPEPWLWRRWRDHGIKHVIGKELDKHIGVVRDAIEAHMIEHYIDSLKYEIDNYSQPTNWSKQ